MSVPLRCIDLSSQTDRHMPLLTSPFIEAGGARFPLYRLCAPGSRRLPGQAMAVSSRDEDLAGTG